MTIKKAKLQFVRFYNTGLNIILFKVNSVLTYFEVLFASETIGNLRMGYGNWYNLQLMRRFIECDYYLHNKHVTLGLESMETIGTLVIAKVEYNGMSRVELNDYLSNSIGGFIPRAIENIQVSTIDDSHAKIIFPI